MQIFCGAHDIDVCSVCDFLARSSPAGHPRQPLMRSRMVVCRPGAQEAWLTRMRQSHTPARIQALFMAVFLWLTVTRSRLRQDVARSWSLADVSAVAVGHSRGYRGIREQASLILHTRRLSIPECAFEGTWPVFAVHPVLMDQQKIE